MTVHLISNTTNRRKSCTSSSDRRTRWRVCWHSCWHTCASCLSATWLGSYWQAEYNHQTTKTKQTTNKKGRASQNNARTGLFLISPCYYAMSLFLWPHAIPCKVRRELEQWVPSHRYVELTLSVIGFGQSICSARNPKCDMCPVRDSCPYPSLHK